MGAWVRGGATEVEAAVAAAAELLGRARTPVFAGLCADLAGIRAAYRLAEAVGASLDPAAGGALYADLDALSTGGGMTTTAAEALGRADAVLVVGARPWDGAFASEIAGSRPTRGRAAGSERAVLALGGVRNGGSRHIAYGTGNAGLPAALGHLRAHVRGHLAGGTALADLAARLVGACYGVVLYDPGELGPYGVEMLQGLTKDLSERTRFFALPVSDPFQGRAVLQLSAWTTGQAPRVGFGRGLPEHDPWRFDSARQIREGEADAALWLAALPAPRPDWLAQVPSIALVGQGSAEAVPETAEIVIAVGVPGASTGGSLWHERRGVIAYTAASAAEDEAPETAAGVLARIRERLRDRLRDTGQGKVA